MPWPGLPIAVRDSLRRRGQCRRRCPIDQATHPKAKLGKARAGKRGRASGIICKCVQIACPAGTGRGPTGPIDQRARPLPWLPLYPKRQRRVLRSESVSVRQPGESAAIDRAVREFRRLTPSRWPIRWCNRLGLICHHPPAIGAADRSPRTGMITRIRFRNPIADPAPGAPPASRPARAAHRSPTHPCQC
jgi:hypothetical protein